MHDHPMDPTAALLPQVRELRLDGPAASRASLLDGAVVSTAPGSEAWQSLADLHPEALPDEGYVLRITGDHAVIAARDDAGLAHGVATLRQLERSGYRPLSIRDWPQLLRRGVVEGFYGAPWSHGERLDFLAFAGGVKFNTYLYAPKDDAFHRDRWREPYPDDALAGLAELAAAATEHQVRLVYALAPGLSMRFSDEAEHAALAAKAEQLWQAGIRSFSLLFDDVPPELSFAGDLTRFGTGREATGAAHGEACAQFTARFLVPHGIREPLLVCPTDYAGCAPSPYRTGLAGTLPTDAEVLWTGPDIVVGQITREHIDEAAASYGRDLVLWDNFPVNDFDRTRLFLGPLLGRSTYLVGSALKGTLANPMVQARASRFSLATVAEWSWNAPAYDPPAAAERALALVAGADAHTLAPLVSACSAWPPSAPQSARLEALTERALAGDGAALDDLEIVLGDLAGTGQHDDDASASALVRELEPWISAARDVGRAGLLACRLLRRLDAPGSHGYSLQREGLRVARTAAEAHYANVLRSIIPGFVDAVLERASGAGQRARARNVTVLIGASPSPGDRELGERLGSRGFQVALTSAVQTREALESTDLVIVTRGASVEAARVAVGSAVPVLAWGHLEALGLATESAVTLSRDSIEITDPASPLAARLTGEIRVYLGTDKITWGEPSAGAQVVARATDHHHPVIVHYPAGTTLPDGTVAAAPRVTSFLGSQGLAPWLVSPEGRALVDAAVDHLAPFPGPEKRRTVK
jgi:hypothetical protein